MGIALLLLSATVFIYYVIWVYRKYGELKSISHSYYYHDNGWYFLAFMCGVGLPVAVLGAISDPVSWWLVGAGWLFTLCGVAPAFRGEEMFGDQLFHPNESESFIHAVGAEGGILLVLTHVVINGMWYSGVALAIPVLYMYFKKTPNHTWWIEVLSFAILLPSLLYLELIK